jgi:hypothetical protein
MSPSLRLTVDIDIDIDNEFEKDFMCWHDNCKRNGNEDDVRNALLTGYFIVSRGINEFYKRYYEHDFKAICEAEQVDKLNGAKRDLDNTRKEYESRLLNLQYEKEELERRLYEYTERMKEQKAIVEREYMEYYKDKKQKEIDLVNLEKDKNIKDLQIFNLISDSDVKLENKTLEASFWVIVINIDSKSSLEYPTNSSLALVNGGWPPKNLSFGSSTKFNK